jgi:Sigma-70, region 4
MAELDALPADQRAVLQLLLVRGQSYGELSDLLKIDPGAVRDRAHAALEALGPNTGRRLAPERRAEVSDYLLGQQTASQRTATREHLAGSASARAWARVVADSLRPLAGEALPEIPEEGPETEAEGAPAATSAPATGEARATEPAREPEPGIARAPDRSRLGGALLLGGVGVLVLAVVAILVISGGGGGGSKRGGKASAASSTPTNQSTTAQATPIAQINLAPSGGGKAVGLAQVFAQGNRRLLIVAGQGLAQGAYALWLYTSQAKSKLLGFVPSRVGKNGRFVTQGQLPTDASNYANLIVTSEQVAGSRPQVPKSPGRIVLQGRLQTG